MIPTAANARWYMLTSSTPSSFVSSPACHLNHSLKLHNLTNNTPLGTGDCTAKMECIPAGGLGCPQLSFWVRGASPKEMAAPRRAAASSAEEGGDWGFSSVAIFILSWCVLVGSLKVRFGRMCGPPATGHHAANNPSPFGFKIGAQKKPKWK